MLLEEEIDLPEFRKFLGELRIAFQKAKEEDEEDYPQEMDEILTSMGRLEKELANEKSQQTISDFLMVYSFINSLSEKEDNEDDEEDFDFEFDDEDKG